MKNVSLTVASVLVAALTACGGAPAAKTPDAEDGAGSGAGSASSRAKTAAIASKAQDTFKDALADLVAMDKAVAEGSKQWSEGECDDVAEDFLDASKQQGKGKFPEALYNAGLALHRCGKKAEAKEQFEGALKADSKFHRARTQLALYAYASEMDKIIG